MLAIMCLGNCIADPDFASGAERDVWLEAFRQDSKKMQQDKTRQTQSTIRHLDLARDSLQPDYWRLSVDLHEAGLDHVMAQILADKRLGYVADSIPFRGKISARFHDKPLVPALNILLQGSGVFATMQDGILTFAFGSHMELSAQEEGEAETQIANIEIALNHIAAPDMVQLISDLFEPNEYDSGPQLSVGSVAELNTIFLSGRADLVRDAQSVVAQADRPVAHVIIAALVVDIDTSSVESLGVQLADISDGNFSVGSIIPNTTSGNFVATFEELASNTAQLTATIKFLAAQNIAQVLSRPYIATRSTMPATIKIVDDQFARVDASSDDASIITTDSITAGISMTITPIVMADSSVRLDVSIEDSRFSPTAGDIIIAKERNAASTSMIVESGQTIVIGGLNSRYRITEKSGLPWLRHIPILNVFTSEQDALEMRSELVVYLTPYIWMPGMDLPMPLQDKLAATKPDMLSLEQIGEN